MKTATPEIRALVIRACLEGKATRRQLAEIFGYHADTLGRWVRQSRQGRTKPLPRGHRQSVFSAEERSEIEKYIHENPYATLEDIRRHLRKDCSLVTVHNALKSLGYEKKRQRNAMWRRRREPDTSGCGRT